MPLYSFPDFAELPLAAAADKLTPELAERFDLLTRLLARAYYVQAGPERYEQFRQAVELSEEGTEAHPRLASFLADISTGELTWMIRAFTALFHLLNRSEQQEIVRINRQRERQATPDSPRAESIQAAVYQLKQAGYSCQEVVDLVQQLVIEPTLTAHPTEARRRTILHKQQNLSSLVDAFFSPLAAPDQQNELQRQIFQQMTLFLGTSEVRRDEITVDHEAAYGHFFLTNSIWRMIPTLYHDLRRALRLYYDEEPELPVFLRYRSWIGGDRDGNPKVTHEVTERVLAEQRQAILELYLTELAQLEQEMSLSTHYVPDSDELEASIRQDLDTCAAELPQLAEAHEPWRRKLEIMIGRLRALRDAAASATYSAAAFVQDLELLRRTLGQSLPGLGGKHDRLDDLWLRAKTFGFHLAALDIRQHSGVHEAAVAELLRIADVHPAYEDLSEADRLELLRAELRNPRPLQPVGAELAEPAREVIDTFRLIRQARQRDPDCIGAYIISMTHEVSDVLEVLLLAKETGLLTVKPDGVTCDLDIVPLLETIADLRDAADLFDKLLLDPVYAYHVNRRGRFQEIMLGYSDSCKDGGYAVANWSLYNGQRSLAAVAHKHDITLRFFHGRGGSIGRGGGRAGEAILAMPANVRNGHIRFTEQGEIISFRYALDDIARRHLEQIVHSMMLATANVAHESGAEDIADAHGELLHQFANSSMATYRELITHDDFWSWFVQMTPIAHISRLRIASRPISRKSANEVDFEGLRAIPWVFAWTQTRYGVPGWYGLGSGLQAALDKGADLETLRHLYQHWSFFRTMLRNAELELCRARPVIADTYGRPANPDMADRVDDEYARTCQLLCLISEQEDLLNRNPVLQKLIAMRNPLTDILNLVQVELLNRWRDGERSQEIRHALLLSINAIAAAMQSTG